MSTKTTTHTIESKHFGTYIVDVTPKSSVRVRTTRARRVRENGELVDRDVAFDRTFKVGDAAEYNSYNLSYYGVIVGIGAKTVTIVDDGRVHRLSLEKFAWRNYDFDLAEASARNSETMNYI